MMTDSQEELYQARVEIGSEFGTGGSSWTPITASGAGISGVPTFSAGSNITLYVLEASMIRSTQALPQVGIYTAPWWGVGADGLSIEPGTILKSVATPTLGFLVDGEADVSQGAPLFPLRKYTGAPPL